MKNNIKWSVLALLLLTVPVTYCAEESEIYHEDIGDRTNETEEERELRDKSIELERVRHMRSESFAYSDSDPKKSPLQSTKVTFEKPTNWQKISNFFSRIFGDSGVVRDGLRQHDSSTSNSGTALSDSMQRKTFLALRPDQQLENLNEWTNREKEKFESAKANVEKTNTAALKDLETKRQKLEKTVEQTNKETSTEITKFKNNYTKLRKTFTTLPELNENPTAKEIQDATQALQKNNTDIPSIARLKSELLDSAEIIKTNTDRITQDRQRLAQKSIDLQKENLNNHINTQKEFNARVKKFQSEIQAILDSNQSNKLQLTYNVDTGQFEYHTARSGDAAPLNKSFDAENHAQGLLRDQMTRPRSASVVTNRDEDDVPSQVFRPEYRVNDEEQRRKPATTGTQQHQSIETGLSRDIRRNEAPAVAHAPEYKYLNANGDIDLDKLPQYEKYRVVDEYLAAHPEVKEILDRYKSYHPDATTENYKYLIDSTDELTGLRAFMREQPDNIDSITASIKFDNAEDKEQYERFSGFVRKASLEPTITHSEKPTPIEATPAQRYEYLNADGAIDLNKINNPNTSVYRVLNEYLTHNPEAKTKLLEFNTTFPDTAPSLQEYQELINNNKSTMSGLSPLLSSNLEESRIRGELYTVRP